MRFQVGIFVILFGLQVSCGSQVDDLKSTTQQSTVPTTETDGVVTATVNPAVAAKVVASASGTLADASVLLPAGTLAINTDAVLKVGPATDLTSSVATSLGIASSAFADGTGSLFVGSTTQNIAVNNPLVISMPLPITSGNLGLASSGTLALIYVIYNGTGFKAGLKVLGETDLRGIFIETSVAGLGFYRVVYLPIKVENKEVTVTYTPGLASTQK